MGMVTLMFLLQMVAASANLTRCGRTMGEEPGLRWLI
jgi:hypothetical protein